MRSVRQAETMCSVCERIIGVHVTKFKSNDNPKVCRHRTPAGQWCTGSGLTIHPNTIMGTPAPGYGRYIGA